MPGSGGGLVLDVADAELDRRAGHERRASGEHLVEDDAGAVDVRRGGRRDAAGLLRGHVPRRADHRPRGCARGCLGQPRDAEVPDLHPAVGRQHHVRRLDVAVQDSLAVRAAERRAQLRGDGAGLLGGQGPAPQPLGEALALDQLGHVVGPLLGVAEVEHLHDARVVDTREQLRLVLESLDPGAVLGPPGLDHLDGDGPCEAAVAGAVDAAEGALADRGDQLVAAVERSAGEVGCAQHRDEYSATGALRRRRRRRRRPAGC